MHSHSTQIPFWSDEHSRNLNRMWRNKCCNNFKGGGKPTRHAELLFSNLSAYQIFFFSEAVGLVSSVIPFAACWRMKWALVKREVYGFKSYSMDWNGSSLVLRLCANHLPREFHSLKKKYSFIFLFSAYSVIFSPNCLAQWRKVLFFINAYNLISVCGYIIIYFLFSSILAHPY